MIQTLVFVAGSVAIVWVSWPSLRKPHGHGFFRFFAFETILALVALVLVVHGFWLLRVVGKPTSSIEQTTELVEVGAHRYIRHPLYSSLLWLNWGRS